jgi:hypothetical protein
MPKTPEAQIKKLQEMLDSKEPLHPELAKHLSSGLTTGMPGIFHPLHYEVPFLPGMEALSNKRFLWKKQAVADALEKGKYSSYIFLHERPYRLNAFAEIAHKLDDEAYWKLLGEIHVDSENIWQNFRAWCHFSVQ